MRKLWKTLITIWMITYLCLGAAASQQLAVERQVYDFLTQEMGLPSASACGILANIEHESAFNLQALGDNGTSFGLCQWHDGRYSNLKAYCRGRGLDYRSVEGQLSYLKFELETGYTSLYSLLMGMENSANGAYRAAQLWCTEFERPANMEQRAKERAVLAKGKYWNRYNSLIVLSKAEVPPTEEEIIQAVTQTEVTLPQPPEGTTVERVDGVGTLKLPIRPYIPRHRPPRVEAPSGNIWVGISAALLFIPVSDGVKARFSLEEPEEDGVLV